MQYYPEAADQGSAVCGRAQPSQAADQAADQAGTLRWSVGRTGLARVVRGLGPEHGHPLVELVLIDLAAGKPLGQDLLSRRRVPGTGATARAGAWSPWSWRVVVALVAARTAAAHHG